MCILIFAITTLILRATESRFWWQWKKMPSQIQINFSKCITYLKTGTSSLFTLAFSLRKTVLILLSFIFSVLKVTTLLNYGISVSRRRRTRQTKMEYYKEKNA